jgi:flagellar biosynthesis protein FliR
MSVALFLSGIFIDLDHWLDYFIHEKKVRLDVKDFFTKCEGYGLSKVYLVLHSYELIILLAVVVVLTKNTVLAGVLAGVTTHLVFDQFTNGAHMFGYSFIFRAFTKFDIKTAFPKPPKQGIKKTNGPNQP